MPLTVCHKLSALRNYIMKLDWVGFYAVPVCRGFLYMDHIILTGEGFDTRGGVVSTEQKKRKSTWLRQSTMKQF